MPALRADGLAVGSVSGGCIEDDLVLRAQGWQLPTDRANMLPERFTATGMATRQDFPRHIATNYLP